MRPNPNPGHELHEGHKPDQGEIAGDPPSGELLREIRVVFDGNQVRDPFEEMVDAIGLPPRLRVLAAQKA